MNLTNSIRQAIVSAVMHDVPRVHTKDLAERLQKLIDEDIAKHAPKPIAAMWADPQLRTWLSTYRGNCSYLQEGGGYEHSLDNVWVSVPQARYGSERYMLSKQGQRSYTELVKLAAAEATSHRDAKLKLEQALAGVRTVKQFKAQFPELEKYAPKEEAKSSFLPAVANVMADLTKLGWPDKSTAQTA